MPNRREFLKKAAICSGIASITPMQSILSMDRVKANEYVSAPALHSDAYTIHLPHIKATPVLPRQITIPDVNGFKVLKGDFHIHTLFSDGAVMPRDRVIEAVQNGLDVIAITDHIEHRPFFSETGRWKLADRQGNNFNLWYEIAKPEADKNNLLLIRGAEITKKKIPPGHFNVLFADDNNPIAAAVDDWQTMLQIAADQGAFLLWNHPGWEKPNGGGIMKGEPVRFTDIHEKIYRKGLIHGVEVFNKVEYYPVVSDWCNEHKLAIFANSDIHASEVNQYGIYNRQRPITLVLAKERSVESIREALFAQRTVAWAADMVWGSREWLTALFSVSVTMKIITPGVIEMTNISSLPVSVSAGNIMVNLPQDRKMEIFHMADVNNITVNNWITGMNKSLEIPLPIQEK